MTPDQAVALALSGPGAGAAGGPAAEGAAGNGGGPGGPGRTGGAGAVAGLPLPNQLTPRERQIIALIAAGLSNRQIAEELVIAPATAARHVANILAKLEFSSRSQIAAWAKSARN